MAGAFLLLAFNCTSFQSSYRPTFASGFREHFCTLDVQVSAVISWRALGQMTLSLPLVLQ